MQIEEIKTAILALPDKEIGPLHNWLQDYYDGEVWDRQIENDFKELGAEKFVQVLQSGMPQASEKRQAALRLMNNMQCHPVPASESAACCSCPQALFMNSAYDETEKVRRSRLAVINSTVETHDSNAERKRLEALYGRGDQMHLVRQSAAERTTAWPILGVAVAPQTRREEVPAAQLPAPNCICGRKYRTTMTAATAPQP
jgi:hypothetical protein